MDDPQLPDRDRGVGGQPGADRRHVRPGADLQPRLRRALRQFDRTHAAYLEQFYGVDIRDSTLYHLVLDSTCLEFDACVEIIAEAARSHRVVVADQPRNGPRH